MCSHTRQGASPAVDPVRIGAFAVFASASRLTDAENRAHLRSRTLQPPTRRRLICYLARAALLGSPARRFSALLCACRAYHAREACASGALLTACARCMAHTRAGDMPQECARFCLRPAPRGKCTDRAGREPRTAPS
eukprot:6178807-Pleurochrysis_carterae.AAC.1